MSQYLQAKAVNKITTNDDKTNLVKLDGVLLHCSFFLWSFACEKNGATIITKSENEWWEKSKL